MYAITLETARQDNLKGGRTYGFSLENSAYSPVQPNKIYSGDKNELVLKLTNHATESLQLFGGELPASAKSEPDLKSSPTTLFLDFGDVFTPTELDRMSVARISVGDESKSFKDADWKFMSFAKENRLGLCPGSDVVLPAGKSVAFHFAGVNCTNQEFAQHSLHIYYSNLGGRLRKNLGFFTITPLMVSDPPETKTAIGNNLTVYLTSADDSEPAKAWITSQLYLDANPNSWLPTELKLKLAYTPKSGEGALDLTGAEFLLSFVAGDETNNGALTTPEQVNQIGCDKDENWSVDKDHVKPWQHWIFTTHQPLKANSTAIFKFNNIHIGPKFLAGDAYAYLLFRRLPGFQDGWFVLKVVRSQATPVLSPLTGPTADVPYGTGVQLSWSSFAVPYLGLAYSTDYPTGIPQPVNKPVPGAATNADQGGIGDKTTFILSGYNSKADFSNNKPLPGVQKLVVHVTHTPPTINSFTAICNQQNARLQWDVAFKETPTHLDLNLEVDHNPVTVNPVSLKGSMALQNRDFKNTPVLTLYAGNKLDQNTKKAELNATIDIVKSVTFTPDSPFILGTPEQVLVEYEVECSNIAGTTMEFYSKEDGVPLHGSTDNQAVFPMESGKHKKTIILNASNTFSSQQNPPWVKFGRKASGSSVDQYIGQYATYKHETVEEFLVRKVHFACCYRCNVDGYDNWFNECDYISFFWEGGHLKAKYFMDIGAKGYHGSWEFTSPVRFKEDNILIINGPNEDQYFKGGTETGAGQPFDNGEFRVRNASADVIFTLKPKGLALAHRPWQISWRSDSWQYFWDVRVPWDQTPISFFQWYK
jgi:hypothetical protein